MGDPGDDGGNACVLNMNVLNATELCALKNGYGGKFYIIYIFLQL